MTGKWQARQWAQHIMEMDEQYHPFAEQVQALAKVYDSHALEELVEGYLNEKEK